MVFKLVSYGGFCTDYREIFGPTLGNGPVIILDGGSKYIVTEDGRTGTLKVGVKIPTCRVGSSVRGCNVSIFSSGCALCNSVSKQIVSVLTRRIPRVRMCDVSRTFLGLRKVQSVRSLKASVVGGMVHKANVPIDLNVTPAGALTGITGGFTGGCPTCGHLYVVSARRGHAGTLRLARVKSV